MQCRSRRDKKDGAKGSKVSKRHMHNSQLVHNQNVQDSLQNLASKHN